MFISRLSTLPRRLSTFIISSLITVASASAQSITISSTTPHQEAVANTYPRAFRDLGVGISVGTTGLGIDVSSHISSHFRLRTGIDFTPHIAIPLSFSLLSYNDGGVHSGNFASMQRYMKRLSGIDVDEKVEMDGKPTMVNFKLIADYYPWADKGWHVSGGFYVGSRKVAKAVNTMSEMPSLLAVNIYNHFYDYFMNTDFYDTPIYSDIYLDPFLVDEIRADLEENGMMGIHVGDFKDGRPYMMQPDSDGMVKANAFVNAFRPYVGVGYTGPVTKDKRLNLDIDLGMMMWGGSPKIITHDGIDLTNDVVNIKGKPGDYVDFFKKVKVYPVLNFRLSYQIFK